MKYGRNALLAALLGIEKVGFIVLHMLCASAEAFSASPQYERVPTLTTAKGERKLAKNLLATSREIHMSA
jgi:hypothetical protein